MEPTHITCCNPDLAICGFIPKDCFCDHTEGGVFCPLCELVAERFGRCPSPQCPYRRWQWIRILLLKLGLTRILGWTLPSSTQLPET